MVKVLGDKFAQKAVAIIGDSTFMHSGITGLVDCVYTKTPVTVVILDNNITAMTGQQENPTTGRDIRHEPAPHVDIEALVRALGVTLWKRFGPMICGTPARYSGRQWRIRESPSLSPKQSVFFCPIPAWDARCTWTPNGATTAAPVSSSVVRRSFTWMTTRLRSTPQHASVRCARCAQRFVIPMQS